jgi:predicted enzyme related to lactoylglutathione lyase
MAVTVYGCNHVVIEVDDVEKAVAFYEDVFNLKKLETGRKTHHGSNCIRL